MLARAGLWHRVVLVGVLAVVVSVVQPAVVSFGGEVADPVPGFRSEVATNLSLPWSDSEWAFIDAFHTSVPWISGTSGVFNDGRALDLDANGWVKSLLPGQIARTGTLKGALKVRPAGNYLVLYDGEGTISYGGGAAVVSQSPGRDVIAVEADGGIDLNIKATIPSDHVRNIRIIMPGGVYADDPYTTVYIPDPGRDDFLSFEDIYDELVFHPDFLDSLRNYSSVRFMNWMRTNHSEQEAWADRPKPEHAHWTGEGVPVEVMVDLANALQFDPWFNIPHLATDGYITEFATIVKNRLDVGLTPYVELSNEVSNTTFTQHDDYRARGVAMNLDPDPFTAAMYYHAIRSTETFEIWETVFGGPGEFHAVVHPGSKLNAKVLDYSLNGADLSGTADIMAMNGYFGFKANRPGECEEVGAMTLSQFFDAIDNEYIPIVVDDAKKWVAIAEPRGLEFAVYEGGQHFRQNTGCGMDNQNTISDLFDQAVDDPRMKDSYLTFLDAMVDAGTVLFAHYHSTGLYTSNNRFGSRQHLEQPRGDAPRYDAMMTFAESGGIIPPPDPKPRAGLSPTRLTFSDQLVDTTSVSQPVTLTNTGTASLDGVSVSLTGPFSQSNNCPGSMSPGANCVIDVSFAPTVVGAAAATLKITSNAASSPDQVALAGTGVAEVPPSGLVDPKTGIWYFRDKKGVQTQFFYGNPGDLPFLGDWNCNGEETPGLYRQSDGFVYLRNSNTQGNADIRFFFGNPGDVPLAGDFNEDGCDTVSIYRPSEARFYIINELGSNNGGLGAADFFFLFGNQGDKPVVGDWDGDGIDEIGLHRESSGLFYYRNTLNTGIASDQFFFGDPGDRFVAGDWGIVDGVDTPAVYRPSTTTWYFRYTNTKGNADAQLSWGKSWWLPVAVNSN